MENNTSSLNKSAMYYGAIIGILLVSVILLSYVFNMTTQRAIGYFQYIIIVGGITLAQIKYRNNNLNGYMSYGKALGFGTLTIFYASVITGFFTYILYAFIEPGLIEQILEMTEQAMVDKGMSDEEIDMALTFSRKFTSPTILAVSAVFGSTFIGFLFSLITSIFTKKKDDSFESNFQ
ncbi:MAG: DUF4199 domain-containing protein [Bacteroidales bacterium]|nr:DUF4199 domain-containing protein [Bacteroidales bacterium]